VANEKFDLFIESMGVSNHSYLPVGTIYPPSLKSVKANMFKNINKLPKFCPLILWRCQKAAALKKERKIVLSCLIISYAA
jgi:hypothetical protein